ncbi:heavy-metal-associated domain-containing family protein [Tripterygium wilfordii]|uniref:Heavy-metal-associated domain-containing family protein n=1 Tax=Tripterygium wilfordii TaxID=458696 RepID=A0A7J7DZW4_TRIWF|nr:heavy metal-associated isoprenylated plant protein 37 [Tripterygium wilfordii]KAF5751857.1 heavy-metal-associated domain-containing family protein [Tripterygium wilfordii]
MTKGEDFKLLKIQTCVLKVNMHCDGCKQKVKKLLRRIEGVYQVSIDAEQQRVTVSGSVDAATLITKLVRAGKHAELWSHKSTQNPKQNNCIKDDKNNKGQKQGQVKGVVNFKNQQNFPLYIDEEGEFCDDDEDMYEEDELAFPGDNANQLGVIRQAINASNAKKGLGVQPTNNGKMNNNLGNVNGGKKEIPIQNMGMKINPSGIDQKTLAALKMNNLNLNGGNINAGEGRRTSDIGAMMGLAGFPTNGGNVANVVNPAALGGNPNGLGGFQVQHSNNNGGFQGSSSAGLFPNGGYGAGQQFPSSMLMNMSGYNHPSMMMNRQQPQMMYNRSPYIPPSTGYYYNGYYPAPSYYPEQQREEPNFGGDHSGASAINDENSSSCSIM